MNFLDDLLCPFLLFLTTFLDPSGRIVENFLCIFLSSNVGIFRVFCDFHFGISIAVSSASFLVIRLIDSNRSALARNQTGGSFCCQITSTLPQTLALSLRLACWCGTTKSPVSRCATIFSRPASSRTLPCAGSSSHRPTLNSASSQRIHPW